MAQKGLYGARQRVPVGRADSRDAVEESAREWSSVRGAGFGVMLGLDERSRYLSASSADMQPVPAEVTAWR